MAKFLKMSSAIRPLLLGLAMSWFCLASIEIPCAAPVSSSLLSPKVSAALSIHVESYNECPLGLRGRELKISACRLDAYERHHSELDILRATFVDSARGVNLPLSFEFEENFLSAAYVFKESHVSSKALQLQLGTKSSVRGRLDALVLGGHSLAVHANAEDYYRGLSSPGMQEPALQLPSVPGGGASAQARMSEHFGHLKSLLEDSRVQARGIRVTSISGICSQGDWLNAVAQNRFSVVGGIVSYCLTSLPAALIPVGDIPNGAATPEDACPEVGSCHATYPYLWFDPALQRYELKEATHAWRMAPASSSRSSSEPSDWLKKVRDGKIANIPGTGTLSCLAEKKGNANRWDNNLHCEFCRDDIVTYFEILDQTIQDASVRDPAVLATVLSVGEALGQADTCEGQKPATRRELLEEFALRMQKGYVDAGLVSWKTIPQLGVSVLSP